jgi:hypothetical protein
MPPELMHAEPHHTLLDKARVVLAELLSPIVEEALLSSGTASLSTLGTVVDSLSHLTAGSHQLRSKMQEEIVSLMLKRVKVDSSGCSEQLVVFSKSSPVVDGLGKYRRLLRCDDQITV